MLAPRGIPLPRSAAHGAGNTHSERAMPETKILLDHERLDVYQLARELVRTGNTIMQHVPTGRADLIDQFRRTCLSIPLNIAEGGGEFAPKEKARFYRIAKRSATECSAVLDHMVDLDLLHNAEISAAKSLLHRIVGALVRLILSTEKIHQPRPPATPRTPARERVRVPAT